MELSSEALKINPQHTSGVAPVSAGGLRATRRVPKGMVLVLAEARNKVAARPSQVMRGVQMSAPDARQRKRFYVYSRPGCHLCELLIEELTPLIRDRLDLEVRDIDSRPEWKLKYGVRIPLVEYDGQTVCQHRLDAAAVRAILDSLPAS